MPAKKKTALKRAQKKRSTTARTKDTEVVRRRRVTRVKPPEPTVDTIVTETDIVTEPRVEIRKPATLAQALTEPAVAVVKPQRKVVSRVVKAKRDKRVA